LSFEEYIKPDLENIKNNTLDVAQCGQKSAIISRGIYFKQLEMWKKLFPKEQIFIFDSNELSQKPVEIMNKIFKFLNLPDYRVKKRFHNKKFMYDKMDNNTREKLIEFYKPINEKLFNIIGEKYNWNK